MPKRLKDRIELVGRRMRDLEKADPAEIQRQSLDRVRRLVDWHVFRSTNTAYRDLLEDAHVRIPVKIDAVEDLAQLPIIDKAFLAANGYASKPSTGDQRVTIVETSGTTSSVVRIPHSPASIQAGLGDSFLRCLSGAGLVSTSRFWTIGHRTHPRQVTGSYLSFEWLKKVAPDVLVSNTTDDLEESLGRAAALSPDCIASAPGFLTRLATHLLDSKSEMLQPSVVLYGGAALLDEGRLTIREALRPSRIVAFYPTTDGGPIGWSAYDDDQYATFTETHFVEVLDSNGAAVRPGSRGRLVATVLDNMAAPLIRYAIGDEVTLIGAQHNRVLIGEVQRVGEVSLGDGLLSISEVHGWASRLSALGHPVTGTQLVIRTGPSGLDQPIIRIFADHLEESDPAAVAAAAASSLLNSHEQVHHGAESGALHAAIVEILGSNWQMRFVAESRTIEPAKIEILPRVETGDEGWKMKPVVDERETRRRGTNP